MSRIVVVVVAAIAVAMPVAAVATPTSHFAANLLSGPHRGIGEMRTRHERFDHPYGNLTITWLKADQDHSDKKFLGHPRTVVGTRIADEPSRVSEALAVRSPKASRTRRHHRRHRHHVTVAAASTPTTPTAATRPGTSPDPAPAPTATVVAPRHHGHGAEAF